MTAFAIAVGLSREFIRLAESAFTGAMLSYCRSEFHDKARL